MGNCSPFACSRLNKCVLNPLQNLHVDVNYSNIDLSLQGFHLAAVRRNLIYK